MAFYREIASMVDGRIATNTNEMMDLLVDLNSKLDLLLNATSSLPRQQFSPAETAEILSCSVRWLSELERDYGLRSYRIGRSRYYAREELERFVREQAGIKTNRLTYSSSN